MIAFSRTSSLRNPTRLSSPKLTPASSSSSLSSLGEETTRVPITKLTMPISPIKVSSAKGSISSYKDVMISPKVAVAFASSEVADAAHKIASTSTYEAVLAALQIDVTSSEEANTISKAETTTGDNSDDDYGDATYTAKSNRATSRDLHHSSSEKCDLAKPHASNSTSKISLLGLLFMSALLSLFYRCIIQEHLVKDNHDDGDKLENQNVMKSLGAVVPAFYKTNVTEIEKNFVVPTLGMSSKNMRRALGVVLPELYNTNMTKVEKEPVVHTPGMSSINMRRALGVVLPELYNTNVTKVEKEPVMYTPGTNSINIQREEKHYDLPPFLKTWVGLQLVEADNYFIMPEGGLAGMI